MLGAVFVFLCFLGSHFPRFNAFGGHHYRALIAGGLDQTIHPALHPQPVDDDQVGRTHGFGIGRGRLVDMGVAVGTDQGGNLNPVAADIFDHIAQDAETRHDLDLFLGSGRSSASGQARMPQRV